MKAEDWKFLSKPRVKISNIKVKEWEMMPRSKVMLDKLKIPWLLAEQKVILPEQNVTELRRSKREPKLNKKFFNTNMINYN